MRAGELMSRKNKPEDPRRHDKLEFLGGHRDEDDRDALAALVRELAEEEPSGALAARAERERPAPVTVPVGRTVHHIFALSITEEERVGLRHSKESLGFEVVRTDDLESGALEDELTPRTRQILAALKEDT